MSDLKEGTPVTEKVGKSPMYYGTSGATTLVSWDPGFVGPNNNKPTENEIRLRESAIALTIEYFKGSGEVELERFDGQLNKFYGFLQTGSIQQETTDTNTVEVGF